MVNALFTALALIAAGQAENLSARDAGSAGIRSESAAESWRRTFSARKPHRRATSEASADAYRSPR